MSYNSDLRNGNRRSNYRGTSVNKLKKAFGWRDESGRVYAHRSRGRVANSEDIARYSERSVRTDKPKKKNNNNKVMVISIIAVTIAILVCVGFIIIWINVIAPASKQKNAKPAEDNAINERQIEESVTEPVKAVETTETTRVSETTETTPPPPTGWQGDDLNGWRYYPVAYKFYQDSWEEINGKWHYFNSDGIMEKGCYRDGYWIGYDGVRAYDTPGGEWEENDEGRWFEDDNWSEDSVWWPSDMGLWIDGEFYWFDSDGYLDPSITSPEEAENLIEDEEDDDEDYDD